MRIGMIVGIRAASPRSKIMLKDAEVVTIPDNPRGRAEVRWPNGVTAKVPIGRLVLLKP
jgi:hypothetical protein